MITCEIKVNNTTLSFLKIVNVSSSYLAGEQEYEVTVFNIEDETIKTKRIKHDSRKKAHILVKKALQQL